ncbi:hypothetical protein MIR68_008698 [Amoeboaphelidium protococcarum]|nr:hypothetical protein MIR68_008698 [Amoeboaphelidium protococcarum]
MDLLSDMICSIIDPAELIRNVHPDPDWTQAADQCYNILGALINDLNTHQGLYNALKKAQLSGSVRDPDASRVTSLLLNDFEKSGVRMSSQKRLKFVELSNALNVVGHAFTSLSDTLPQYGRPRRKHLHPRSQMLHDIIVLRSEIAHLLDHESYSELYLKDKMAGNKNTVKRFVDRVTREHGRGAEHLQHRRAVIHGTYEIGDVMQSLSSLFELLYGYAIRPAEILTGESWHEDVIKADVIDVDCDAKVGSIYFDLFSRRLSGDHQVDKINHPSQFTVRCSRLIQKDDLDHYRPDLRTDFDTEGLKWQQGVGVKQLPILTLVCNFEKSIDKPTRLTWPNIVTLAHEMGHAMHSIAARTDYQHVAGSRCALDFVEMPSILMEYFVNSPIFYAQLQNSQLSFDDTTLQQTRAMSQQGLYGYMSSKEASSELKTQLFYSALDQNYHQLTQEQSLKLDTTSIYYDTWQQFYGGNNLPRNGRSSSRLAGPETSFTHLFTYGAGYYSYLWSRTLAHQIFQSLFASQNSSIGQWEMNGRLLRDEVLRHGGSVDPRDMNWSKLLENSPLKVPS